MASSYESYLKQQQDEVNKQISKMYNTSLKSLTGYATQLQADQPTLESGITSAADVQRRAVQAAREQGLQTYGLQRTAAQTGAESAISEARRIASEQMQGLQAQYGSATGTGGFTGELMGRETARGIAGTRQSLAQGLGEINAAEQALTTDVNNKMFQIDTETTKYLTEAKNQLRDRLQEINLKKGELEADKAARRIQALTNFSTTMAQIKSQQDAYKQQVRDQAATREAEFQDWLRKYQIQNPTPVNPFNTYNTSNINRYLKDLTGQGGGTPTNTGSSFSIGSGGQLQNKGVDVGLEGIYFGK